MEVLQVQGVPAAPVRNLGEVMDIDPQLRHRGHFVPIDHTGPGRVSISDWSFKLSETPSHIRTAPCQGEHNVQVCTEILGMSDEELVELVQEGVLK